MDISYTFKKNPTTTTKKPITPRTQSNKLNEPNANPNKITPIPNNSILIPFFT
jgi:hypothetical protein